MQGDKKVIAYLNAQLKLELTAINQYFLHYRMLQELGPGAAGQARVRRIHRGDETRRQADGARAARWGGLPNLQDLGKLLIGETRRGNPGLRPEGRDWPAQAHLKEAVAYCETVRDYVSREICSNDILEDTEEHIDYLETQLELVEKVGEQNYLQSQMHAPS